MEWVVIKFDLKQQFSFTEIVTPNECKNQCGYAIWPCQQGRRGYGDKFYLSLSGYFSNVPIFMYNLENDGNEDLFLL